MLAATSASDGAGAGAGASAGASPLCQPAPRCTDVCLIPSQVVLQSCGDLGWQKPEGVYHALSDEQVYYARRGRLNESVLTNTSVPGCTGFYLVTAGGARIMLESLFPMEVQIDTIDCNLPGKSRGACGATRVPNLNALFSTPPIAQCDERDGRSDVQQGPDLASLYWKLQEKFKRDGDSSSDVSGDPSSFNASAWYQSALNATNDGSSVPVAHVAPIQPCGGVASAGTSDEAQSLLQYFVEFLDE